MRGAHAGACHAQMYVMGSLLRHGSEAQKREYLPKIASGETRLQSFGVTEPTTGTDTTALKTMAPSGSQSGWRIDGQKVWISRVEHSDLMVLLARTTPRERGGEKDARGSRPFWSICGRRGATASRPGPSMR